MSQRDRENEHSHRADDETGDGRACEAAGGNIEVWAEMRFVVGVMIKVLDCPTERYIFATNIPLQPAN